MKTLPARIFLKEQHGPRFFAEETDSFGRLQSFRNELLSPGAEFPVEVAGGAMIILIPVTGDLVYRVNKANTMNELAVGQVATLTCSNDLQITVANTYEEDEINFILIQLTTGQIDQAYSFFVSDFELSANDGQMQEIMASNIVHLWIGRFQGRQQSTHVLSGKRCFYYALLGAFEVQDRLLHTHDGLALWDINEVEMEALSNNALLLALELPYI